MKKYFLFFVAFSFAVVTNAQNRKFDIRAQIAPSYTFFEIADIPPELQNSYGTYGGQKGKIGILYNFEGSYTTSKGWNYSVGYSHYIYKQHASANLSPFISDPSRINTNLYNNLRYLSFETAKFINLNSSNLLYVGAGINFAFQKMQYIDKGIYIYHRIC